MKETEFDRFDRAKKLEREAYAQKRKDLDDSIMDKKKKGRPKINLMANKKNWSKDFSELEVD